MVVIRNLKTTLENHPYFLLLSFLLAILSVIFLFIEVNDHFNLKVL